MGIRLMDVPLYAQKKEELKNLAIEIKNFRKEFRKKQREENFVPYSYYLNMNNLVYQFRCLHIALSLFRGRKIEEIEKPKKEKIINETSYLPVFEDLRRAKEDYEKSTLCSN